MAVPVQIRQVMSNASRLFFHSAPISSSIFEIFLLPSIQSVAFLLRGEAILDSKRIDFNKKVVKKLLHCKILFQQN